MYTLGLDTAHLFLTIVLMDQDKVVDYYMQPCLKKQSENMIVEVDNLLKVSFKPEFLNRLDEIVFYKPLVKDEIKKIVDLMIENLKKRLEVKQLGLKITDSAKDYIIDAAYDPIYGARPLKRFLQQKVETLVARKIIEGNIDEGSTLVVDFENGELVIK